MKKTIIVLLASISFMASSAFASLTVTVEAVQTAVRTVTTTSTAINGITAAAATLAIANNSAVEGQLNDIAEQIMKLTEDEEAVVNGLSKIERVSFLADLYAATVLTKDDYSIVERLFKGKPLLAVMGAEQGSDALDGANLAKFKEFLGAYTVNVASMDTSAAAEAAAQSTIGKSFNDLLEACGAAAGRN